MLKKYKKNVKKSPNFAHYRLKKNKIVGMKTIDFIL
jgi:hypothetical protein